MSIRINRTHRLHEGTEYLGSKIDTTFDAACEKATWLIRLMTMIDAADGGEHDYGEFEPDQVADAVIEFVQAIPFSIPLRIEKTVPDTAPAMAMHRGQADAG